MIMSFGERLTRLMARDGYSIRKLSALTGLTTSTITAYRQDLRNPCRDALVILARQFSTSIDYLCGLTDDEKPVKGLSAYGWCPIAKESCHGQECAWWDEIHSGCGTNPTTKSRNEQAVI